jgi:hypothetical protein
MLFKDRVKTMASDSNIVLDSHIFDKHKKEGNTKDKQNKSILQSITKVVDIAI